MPQGNDPAPDDEAAFAGMTDLAEALGGEDGAALGARLEARLEELALDLSSLMRNGATPERFRRMDTVRTALFRAKEVLVAFRRASPGTTAPKPSPSGE
jgi:hypothetical protein